MIIVDIVGSSWPSQPYTPTAAYSLDLAGHTLFNRLDAVVQNYLIAGAKLHPQPRNRETLNPLKKARGTLINARIEKGL